MSGDSQLFPTITGAHWRESIAQARMRRTRRIARLRAWLAENISAASGGTVVCLQGLRIATGQPPLARGVTTSPLAASPNRWTSARGIAEAGSREALGEGDAAGGVDREPLSPAAPEPDTLTRSDVISADADEAEGAAGGSLTALRAANGYACPSQPDVVAVGPSCSVSRATAGRDRRNF